MSVSACILAERKTSGLQKCLKSLDGCVDEIILGAPDPCLLNGICSRSNVRVVRIQWKNSFADARNDLIRHAKSTHILSIDSDECMRGSLKGKKLSAQLYLIKRHNSGKKGFKTRINARDNIREFQSAFTEMLPRIFRKDSFSYLGRIHEELVSSYDSKAKDQAIKPVILSNVSIIHTGYSDRDTVHEKFRRNMRLLRLELIDCPERKAVHYFMARNYFNQALCSSESGTEKELSRLLKKASSELERYYSARGKDKWSEDAGRLSAVLAFSGRADARKALLRLKPYA